MLTRLMWFIHNTIGHPIAGILFLFGLDKAGDWVHDITLPAGFLDVPQGFVVERVVDLDDADEQARNIKSVDKVDSTHQ